MYWHLRYVDTPFKLFVIPAVPLLFIYLFNQPVTMLSKVLVILLAAPTAIVNFVMASSMEGDTESTSATIVLSTLFLSSVTCSGLLTWVFNPLFHNNLSIWSNLRLPDGCQTSDNNEQGRE